MKTIKTKLFDVDGQLIAADTIMDAIDVYKEHTKDNPVEIRFVKSLCLDDAYVLVGGGDYGDSHYEIPDYESVEICHEPWDIETLERDSIKRALEKYCGNRDKAAQALGFSSRTMYRKIKQYEL